GAPVALFFPTTSHQASQTAECCGATVRVNRRCVVDAAASCHTRKRSEPARMGTATYPPRVLRRKAIRRRRQKPAAVSRRPVRGRETAPCSAWRLVRDLRSRERDSRRGRFAPLLRRYQESRSTA